MRFITLIIIVLLMAACHEKHDTRLDGLEELMATAPDSALNILEELHESTLTTDFDKARYAMLLMMAKDKCYIPLQPDSALLRANEVFHKRKDLKNEMKSRYYAGLAYTYVMDYRQALWEALNAIDLSHEAADTFWMGKAHELAYDVYSETYDYHNAVIEADKAAIFFKRVGATPFHLYALLEKAHALNSTLDPKTKLPLREGVPLLDSLIADETASTDKTFLVSCLLQKSGVLAKAKEYKPSQIIIDSIYDLTEELFAIKQALPIQAQNKLNTNDNPTKEIDQYTNLLTTVEDTIRLLDLKKQLAINQNQWKKATILSDSILHYAEGIIGEKSFNSIDEIAISYNKAISERRKKDLSSLRSQYRAIIIGFLFFIFVVIGISIWYRRHNLKKQEKIMAQIFDLSSERDLLKQITLSQEDVISENSELKAQLENQDAIRAEILKLKMELQSIEPIKSENSRLKEELTSRQNLVNEFEELQQKLQNQEKIAKDLQTTSINKSFERIDFIGTKIDAICDLAQDMEAAHSNPALQKSIYNNLMSEVKKLRSSKYQKQITTTVNSLHNNILERLKEQLPKQTSGDLTWLGMDILGFRPNTICFLLNIEKSTFYSRRLRLCTYIENSNVLDREEFLLFFPRSNK